MTGPTVAYQGAHGAFGEEAVRRRWRDGEPRPMPTFERVVESVGAGVSDYGVLPVWNSVLGDIPWSRAVLADASAVRVAGEITVPIELCLIARHGVGPAAVRYVGSHPAALGQCRSFLAANPMMLPCPAWDTAGAVREVAEDGDESWYRKLPGAGPMSVAAIAGPGAAALHGLEVLARGIQDVADNVTRFAILERAGGAR